MSERGKTAGQLRPNGYALLELAVMLPVLLALVLALQGVFLQAIRWYAISRTDGEMQEQLRIVMERMVRDVERSSAVEVDGGELRLETVNSAGNLDVITYKVGGAEQKMMRKSRKVKGARYAPFQPMTGQSILDSLSIQEFRCEKSGGVLRIVLSGSNLATGHVFSLETAVAVEEGDGEDAASVD